ncbi:HET-domain-containing protein [Neurospora crassa]|uniref:Heterokaryon incompatibility domain-containing protein n=1 Tax=Neurospora crassa (strain ATCC 24698 / 74-OR23-1A / CBS 708.71 / DSM 1257 / FGSC 987) TaxID=367110 RepID=V5ILZ2_NEUCR|nr:hypothetical protein NCU17077 [Neurospora crassa OR74A]ESA42159.1 hypothetical protein NCU17077 [Neurospora crassa OR74A]KHE89042.1 HET-domain-containing protein [Neurospora crassa]|eukprot:XP_011395083.1 hypothetical protein NCU17077 [Neurospora crassa OR74A]
MKRLRKLFSGRDEKSESALTRPVFGLTTTASSLDLAKSWLSSCVAHHPQCNISVNPVNWVPTRLLYFTAGTVQLIETKKTKPTTPYMTLTHRWGFADEEMMLNKRTYPSLIGGIPISSMPKLFQEVITVALHLDVNYIWIDALCIFQDKDDQTDWQNEAGQMQKVYSNSFCNISAADATSCSDTLFSQPRNLKEEILPQTIYLSIPSSSSSSSSSFPSSLSPTFTTSTASQTSSRLLSSILNHHSIPKPPYIAMNRPKIKFEPFTLINLSLWTHQVSHALVNTRAWVLQERVLAPRILHFGRRQLFWECRCSEACEAFPSGNLPSQMTRGEESGVKLTRSLYSRPRLQDQDNSTDLSLYLAWHLLIQTYTKTSLSFPSDKLIAISGLAKLFQSLAKRDDYVAGLWRPWLEGELLWVNASPQCLGAKATTKRPEIYRAPSWSWASIDGPLSTGTPMKGPDHGFKIRVEDVQLSYLTEDKTGAVTGGQLRLRGTLFETELARVSCTNGTVEWTVKLEGVHVLDEQVLPAPASLNPRVCLDVMQENFERENEDGLLFSMVAKTGESVGEHMYMLLFKLVDRQRGVFERLGIMLVAGDITKRRVLDVERGFDKPSLPCVELHEDGQYSIIVI